jgi:hypothetical protein
MPSVILSNHQGSQAAEWLLEKGWSKSDQWWLPPLGPKGHYRQKCYSFSKAIKTEAALRGMTEEMLSNALLHV